MLAITLKSYLHSSIKSVLGIDENIANSIINDDNLRDILLELRKKVADKNKIPPYTVFQDASINEMTLKYPVNYEEMKNIHGVGEGKAKKYGAEFIKLIEKNLGMKAKKKLLPLQPGDVPSTSSNCSELESWIGFKPNTSVSEGVKKFVEWYRNFYAI